MDEMKMPTAYRSVPSFSSAGTASYPPRLSPAWYVARVNELEAAMQRAVKCIDTNLYHQREKVEDAAAILRSALGS